MARGFGLYTGAYNVSHCLYCYLCHVRESKKKSGIPRLKLPLVPQLPCFEFVQRSNGTRASCFFIYLIATFRYRCLDRSFFPAPAAAKKITTTRRACTFIFDMLGGVHMYMSWGIPLGRLKDMARPKFAWVRVQHTIQSLQASSRKIWLSCSCPTSWHMFIISALYTQWKIRNFS